MNQLEQDLYFLRIAKEVSKRSKCLSRKIGSVLVKDGCVISTGVNGPARKVKHCNERSFEFYENFGTIYNPKLIWNENKCPRQNYGYKSGQGLHLCNAVHSERNAILQAARNGICTSGTSLYCACGQVCKDCASELVNAGVKELIYLEGPKYDGYADIILKEGGISVRTINEELL